MIARDFHTPVKALPRRPAIAAAVIGNNVLMVGHAQSHVATMG
ncbi:MAG: hypothetical protein RLZ59_756, partial [Pseudomonadota bacterium]